MEKRVLIAVILSIAVMYGYTIVFPPQKPVQQKEQISPQDTKAPASPAVAASPVQQAAGNAPPVLIEKHVGKDVTIESDVFTVVISPQNGAIRKLVLKKYKDLAGSKGTEIVLIKDDSQAPVTLTSSYPGFSPESDSYFSSNIDNVSLTGSETT